MFDQILTPYDPADNLGELMFRRISDSPIDDINKYYWENYDRLWDFEDALPDSISYSHRPDFINESVEHFVKYMGKLRAEGLLPDKVVILEQGPGTGQYAEMFLAQLAKLDDDIYQRVEYIFQDRSDNVLTKLKEKFSDESKFKFFKNLDDLQPEYNGKISMIRHSNLWDQYRYDLYQVQSYGYDQMRIAVFLGGYESTSIKESRELWNISPESWKQDVYSIEVYYIWTDGKADIEVSHLPPGTLYMYSSAISRDIKTYKELLDLERSAYAEVVDIFREPIGYTLSHGLRNLQGSFFPFINSDFIRRECRNAGFYPNMYQLYKSNHRLRLFPHNMKSMLRHDQQIKIRELAVSFDESVEQTVSTGRQYLNDGFNLLAVSDKAGASIDLQDINSHLESGLFTKLMDTLGVESLPVFAVRRKKLEDIESLQCKMREAALSSAFLVTGDPAMDPQEYENGHTSIDLLDQFANKFLTGVVAHPRIEDISRQEQKASLGAKFFIVQASYDQEKFDAWWQQYNSSEVLRDIPVLLTFIPISSDRVLEFLHNLDDIDFAEKLYLEYVGKSDDELLEESVELIKDQYFKVMRKKQIAGVWIYTRSRKAAKLLIEELDY